MSRHPYADAAAHLDEAQLDTVLDALDDAAEYRLAQSCLDCETEPYGLCHDHVADQERATRYAATARQLRMEAGR